MMLLIGKDDFYHISNPLVFAVIMEDTQVNNTIEIELAGIKMAAMMGFSCA